MKKLLKNGFWVLVAVLLCFTACKEPADETPAQAYFPKGNGSKVDIAIDAKSFDVAVSRVGADGGVRVPIIVTADSLACAWFEFPGAVEFADAAMSAVYTVKVKDGAALEYDKYAKISLVIAGEHAAALGDALYTFEVGVPAPWSEWEKMGEGTYYPSVYWSGEQAGLEVYYRECLANDADAQYCIRGIQNIMNLTVDYNRQTGACRVLPQYAATNYKYGNVTLSDRPHSPLVDAEGAYEDYPCIYDAEAGLFTLNVAYVAATQWGANADEVLGCGVEYFQLDGYVDADYSFFMQYRGHYIDTNGNNNAVISVSKGADVAKCLITVVKADENTNVVKQGMLAGTVPCDTLTVGGFYSYPITASGNYKAVAITYDYNGMYIEAHTTEFEFWMATDSNPWQPIGYALYTDGVLAPHFDMPVSTYYVKVLENKERPGLFRVLDPYAPVCSLYPLVSSYEEGCYIDIDATDPEGVWIEGLYSTGLDIQDYGMMSVTSLAWFEADKYGATKEEVKEAHLCGTYVDGVITFPVDAMVVVDGTRMALYANINGDFALDMSNLLKELPAEEGGKSVAPASRARVKFQGKSIGRIARFKKIDNSFITQWDAKVE